MLTNGAARAHPHSVCVAAVKGDCVDAARARGGKCRVCAVPACERSTCERTRRPGQPILTPIIAFAILHLRYGMCGTATLLTRPPC